jgi:hypothetical protein
MLFLDHLLCAFLRLFGNNLYDSEKNPADQRRSLPVVVAFRHAPISATQAGPHREERLISTRDEHWELLWIVSCRVRKLTRPIAKRGVSHRAAGAAVVCRTRSFPFFPKG